MGKVRSPEEVAARKAKKEAKKDAKKASRESAAREIIQKCARSNVMAAKVLAKAAKAGAVAGPAVEGEAVPRPAAAAAAAAEENEPPLGPQEGAAPGVAEDRQTWGFAAWSLQARLNPKRSCFDATLKAAWPHLPKDVKKNLVNEDKVARAKFKILGLTKPPAYPFPAIPSDHCETSPGALQHIAPFLRLVAKRLGKATEVLQVYDPYYCSGAVKRHLHELGFRRVYNECVDFYAAIDNGTVPEHDVIVSNPPFSEGAEGEPNHIARLLRFCVEGGRPFLLHMPEYVASAAYYAPSFAGDRPLLLAPYRRYHFWMPPAFRDAMNQNGHRNPELGLRTSPFPALWYVCLKPLVSHAVLMKSAAKGRLSGIDVPAGEGPTAPEEPQEQQEPRERPRPVCRLCRSLEQLPPSRLFTGHRARKIAVQDRVQAGEAPAKPQEESSKGLEKMQEETASQPRKKRRQNSQPSEGQEEPPSRPRVKRRRTVKEREVEGAQEEAEGEGEEKPKRQSRVKKRAARRKHEEAKEQAEDGGAGAELARPGEPSRPKKFRPVRESNLEVGGLNL